MHSCFWAFCRAPLLPPATLAAQFGPVFITACPIVNATACWISWWPIVIALIMVSSADAANAARQHLRSTIQVWSPGTVAILAQGTHWAVAVTQAFFAQVRFPLLSLFFNSRASCAQLLLGFLPSSTFGGCHRGCPIRPSLQHSMPSTECHSLLDLLVANRACPYQGVICCCFQCSKDNFCSTIQF